MIASYGLIAFFGLIGIALRILIDFKFQPTQIADFPWHTLSINLFGSLGIGIIFVLASEKNILSESWRLALTSGLMGGFTTFSAFSLQNLLLLQEGQIFKAALYGVGSPLAGMGACYLGMMGTRFLALS